MHHLTIRAAWHDSEWNGRVCKAPSCNSFCVDLDRVREDKDDAREDRIALKEFSDLAPADLPACARQSGGFMNPGRWWVHIDHPYQPIKACKDTHGHLLPTRIEVPPWHTFSTPYNWMLSERQGDIQDRVSEALSPEVDSPFKSPWVFGSGRQRDLSQHFYSKLSVNGSLVVFYTKRGHPLAESHARLVLGIGRVTQIGDLVEYETAGSSPTYPIWDRLIGHSIRPDGSDGFLLPYHAYLAATGDPDEDARRLGLLEEIAVVPEQGQLATFSYAAELAASDVMLSTLLAFVRSVRAIREHGIASGPWEEREHWLNDRIAELWKERGAFPGVGSALEALGFRMGTSLLFDLVRAKMVKPMEDPWPMLEAMFKGTIEPPHSRYQGPLRDFVGTWRGLNEAKRDRLKLMSRFALTTKQATRYIDKKQRAKASRVVVEDSELDSNPYRIVEADLGDYDDPPISMGVIDRGLLPDDTVRVAHPLPSKVALNSGLDVRRVRAGIVSTLRDAASRGDALLSRSEALERLAALTFVPECCVPDEWIDGNVDAMSSEVVILDNMHAVQLVEYQEQEKTLSRLLWRRAEKSIATLGESWKSNVLSTLKSAGIDHDPKNPRHVAALGEQSDALEKITTRRLSVLIGRAGTGKTTVLGALLVSEKLKRSGVLFLAPTGKARVRITQQTGTEAKTIAQFLYGLERYDAARQRPLMDGAEPYRGAKTIVIDECSMLTLDDMYAVFKALDLGHVERLVLVGDPNQLPPIGVGRPFADLVARLEKARADGESAGEALARLNVEVRTTGNTRSDMLALASWFTNEAQPIDADRVLSDLETGATLNDLSVCFWTTPQELRDRLVEMFDKHLEPRDGSDIERFNGALGLTKEGWVPFENCGTPGAFQILTPTRSHPHGVQHINRWIQGRYRSARFCQVESPNLLVSGDEHLQTASLPARYHFLRSLALL